VLLGYVLLNSCSKEAFFQEEPKDDGFTENLLFNYDRFENRLNALYALVGEDRLSQSNILCAHKKIVVGFIKIII